MDLETQKKRELKEYLEETHEGNYGVSLELDSLENKVEAWIIADGESEEPEIDEMFPELGREVGILQPSGEMEYDEEKSCYHWKITEKQEYRVKIDS
ncbi:MAG: hypothetical protein ABEK16_02350 [Candidatus Nanohalobium sp.]